MESPGLHFCYYQTFFKHFSGITSLWKTISVLHLNTPNLKKSSSFKVLSQLLWQLPPFLSCHLSVGILSQTSHSWCTLGGARQLDWRKRGVSLCPGATHTPECRCQKQAFQAIHHHPTSTDQCFVGISRGTGLAGLMTGVNAKPKG